MYGGHIWYYGKFHFIRTHHIYKLPMLSTYLEEAYDHFIKVTIRDTSDTWRVDDIHDRHEWHVIGIVTSWWHTWTVTQTWYINKHAVTPLMQWCCCTAIQFRNRDGIWVVYVYVTRWRWMSSAVCIGWTTMNSSPCSVSCLGLFR